MLLKFTINVLIFAMSISVALGQFDIQLFSCRLSYSAECQDKGIAKTVEKMAPIEGFYWRDFHGNIPDDAFPVGNENQSPQTFVGLAYDEKFDGTFASAIIEGKDYVYNILGETPRKVTQKIVILCTQQPDRMKWLRLTQDEEVDWSDKELVDGGSYVQQGERIFYYAAKASSSNINYVGGMSETKKPMYYADISGSKKTAAPSEYEILYYQKKTDNSSSDNTESNPASGTKKKGSFIKNALQYCINPTSIIPSYYKSIRIAGVSLVCTNQDDKKKEKNKIPTSPDPSSDYYWKPLELFSTTEGFKGGKKAGTGTLYIARTWASYGFGLDVGYLNEEDESVYFTDGSNSIREIYNLKILSTNSPEKLKWIPSNSSSLVTMDKTNLIPGGMVPNGTLTYIGRVKSGEDEMPASIRLTDKGAYAYYYSHWDGVSNFEVLTYNG